MPTPRSHSKGGQGQGKRSANPGLSLGTQTTSQKCAAPLTSYPRPGCLGFGLLSIWESPMILPSWNPEKACFKPLMVIMSNLVNRAARTGPTGLPLSTVVQAGLPLCLLIRPLLLPPTYPCTQPSFQPPNHPSKYPFTLLSTHLSSTHPPIYPSIHSRYPSILHPREITDWEKQKEIER